MDKPFVHLHLHSEYSLLDGAIKSKNLFSRAEELGMPAVALTDHGNMFGALDFYRNAKSTAIKPIIGCEMYVSSTKHDDKTPASKTNHLTVLTMNKTGYQNLSTLVTKAYFDGFYRRPRVDRELLERYNEGLIVLSGCLSGELCSAIFKRESKTAYQTASFYKEVFGDRYYIEIQASGLKEQKFANEKLIEIATKLKIPVVATNDCHYLRKEDSKPHDVLLCIQTGAAVSDTARMKFQGEEFYLKTRDEMLAGVEGDEESLEQTLEIEERCGFEFETGAYKLPDFEVEGNRSLDEHMAELAGIGLEKRFSLHGISPDKHGEYRERLDRELSTISQMGFSGYFLVVSDFISYAKSNSIPVGPGRGSAAGSLVAYSLGITDIDPITYNLLFERFLNSERVSMPDIDVDLCTEGREDVIKYVTRKYGSDKVAQIGTFGTMSSKAVVKDVGRVMGIPYADVDRITKTIPTVRGNVYSIQDCIKKVKEFNTVVNSDERLKELIEMAKSLENMVRHSSTHAAGIVISNEPLHEHIPLYKGPKDEIVTQFDMNGVEYLGFVKFDFLGLKTLTVINKAIELIHQNNGSNGAERININAIPLDDPKVYELLSSAKTRGVFQVESSGMVDLLKRLQPTEFEDVIAVLALFRPGPLDSGMVEDYIKRRHGKKKVTYPHPSLKEVLNETYGLFVYQEQIINTACIIGGFTLGEADLLRRAMGKKKTEAMKAQRDRFLEGAKNNGLTLKKATDLFDTMEKFAEYAFNKSHSAAYALITYQTAYLKAHYPSEFMAALMSVESNNTDKIIQSIAECRDMGIEVLPPDVNESIDGFGAIEGKIRFGLSGIKNVGDSTALSVIQARENKGKFETIFDFCEHVEAKKINRKTMESLIKSGAFDSLGHNRAQLMESIPTLLEYTSLVQKEALAGQSSFAFDATVSRPALPEVEEWGEREILTSEMEALGFYVSTNPLIKYSSQISMISNADSEKLLDFKDRQKVVISGLPRSSTIKPTKNNGIYGNIVLEDLKGSVNVIAFNDVVRNAEHLLEKTIEPIVIRGVVERSDDGVKIIASSITSLREKRYGSVAHITLSVGEDAEGRLEALRILLAQYPGDSAVHLHLLTEAKEVVIELVDYKVELQDEFIDEVTRDFGEKSLRYGLN